MALADVLNSILQGSSGAANGALNFGQSAGAVDPGQSTAPGGQTSTPLSELIVRGQAKPKPQAGPQTTPVSSPPMAPPIGDPQITGPQPGVPQDSQPPNVNYNNSGSVDAVHQANTNNQPNPSTNPGIYGLLPPNLQHGTLRNVLGALGDSLLVSGGKAPEYAQGQARQQIGDAMAGMDINDPQSVQAAVQRVAATGAPGAADMADKLQQQAEQAQLRKATLEQNNWWRQSQVGAKADAAIQRATPTVGGLLSGAKTPEEYAARYAQAEAIAQRIGADYHASDFGAINPKDWQPGMMQGQTGNQIQQHQDRLSGQANTHLDAVLNAQARIRAAQISGGSGIQRANIEAGAQENDSAAGYVRSLADKQDNGQTLTPAEQAIWDHATTLPARAQHRSLPPGQTVGGKPVASGGGQPPIMTPQQAAKLPKGAAFRTTDGRTLHRQ